MEKPQQRSELKNLIQAALFASGKSMGVDEMAAALGVGSVGFLKSAADELAEDYSKNGGPFTISKLGERYELVLREPYASKVSGLAGSPELTRSTLRTLAYISKNEPVLQSNVVKAFGSSAYSHVGELIEKEFVSARRAGRSKRLETTRRFREYFNVESIKQSA